MIEQRLEFEDSSKQRALIQRVVSTVPDREKEALVYWAEQMLALKRSDLSKRSKIRESILVTQRGKIIVPILKIFARELKLDQLNISKIDTSSANKCLSFIKGFWLKRSLAAQVGMGASAIGLAVFGTQGAGIAALGTAIGLPLWIVFGAGAMFATNLIQEITGKKPDLSILYIIPRKSKK
ncbi:hypothetical protein GCM10011309_17310 [Litorimonas cladophorae]|uniref:Uncharacterized protein n=2 Tax=Litorimonas cladophorae TaxID=1220491 RepID=A0A918KM11_9PROT|nr:hypothetical protein GCM10011309_17310 [Litorimonas cladophorae]